MVWNIPLAHSGQLSSCVPYQSHDGSQLAGAGGGRTRKKESIDVVQALSSNSQNTVLATREKHSKIQTTLKKANSCPSQIQDTGYILKQYKTQYLLKYIQG